MQIAINIAAFYAAWFAAVLGAARGLPAVAIGACLAAVILHLVLSKRKGVELSLVIVSSLAGFASETLLVQGGLATYASSGPIQGFAPLWLVGLWAAFATMFNVSLSWLKTRLWLAVLFAFAGGPASYYAGAKLGGMALAEPIWMSLAIIGVIWAIVFPSLLVVARMLDPDVPPAPTS